MDVYVADMDMVDWADLVDCEDLAGGADLVGGSGSWICLVE